MTTWQVKGRPIGSRRPYIWVGHDGRLYSNRDRAAVWAHQADALIRMRQLVLENPGFEYKLTVR